jgi:predicted transcriptional regulator
MPDTTTATTLIGLTAGIVSAFVGHNAVPAVDLPRLIADVHGALAGLGRPVEPVAVSEHKTPAEIRRSVTPEALISFLDGKPYKTLKRHLGTHGMTPEAYRARFGLGHNYPMTAANYAAQRSELAKAAGLGRKAGPRLVGSEAA